MKRFLRTTWVFAHMQFMRNMRDPVTAVVLFGIPVLLLLIFGSLAANGGKNLSLNVAIINNSQTQFAQEFAGALDKVEPFKKKEKELTLDQARDEMNNNNLDTIIELPSGFGEVEDGLPTGKLNVYFDNNDLQTGEIVASIIQSVVAGFNDKLVQVQTPITIERTPVKANEASAFDNVYSIFAGMAIMMVGVFAVGSIFPLDKKTGVMRRMHVTPVKAKEIILGTMLCFTVIGLVGVTILTILALTIYGLDMRGSWINLGVFVLIALAAMLGFGLAIGSVSKNSTQSDIIGQIVFMISLAFSGVWFPRAILPEFLQGITGFLPLTPVIDGIRLIVTENASLISLWPEIAIVSAWGVAVYILGIKLFKWE